MNLGSFAAVGANFDTDGTCEALDADFTQVTPGQLALGPLADNGGPKETHALLWGASPSTQSPTARSSTAARR